MTSAEFVEKQAIELIACRQAQYEIKAQLALMKAIERLADKIAGKPTKVDLHWLVNSCVPLTERVLNMIY